MWCRIRNSQPAIRNVLVLLVVTAVGVAATSDSGDALAQNRWLLNHLRHDRARYTRLQRETERFNTLSTAEQARIRALEQALSGETSETQARLLRAAERYADWLQRLPASDRNQILAETDKDKRLALIRQIRLREWLEHLPTPQRERVEKATDSERANVIAQIRSDEKSSKTWTLAARNWNEIGARGVIDRTEKLPEEVQQFVKENLVPRLHPAERERLRFSEGRWPAYPRTLVDLNDNERIAFRLLLPVSGPKRIDELPADVQKRLKSAKTPEIFKKRLTKAEGHWPEFAIIISEGRGNRLNARPFGPCTPKDFPKATREFIEQKLMTPQSGVLDDAERERLRLAEGLWPSYPKTLVELAWKHRLQIPGASLPGPPELWDRYRDKPLLAQERSVVSDLVLSVFAEFELTPAERAVLDPSLADPVARERLQQEYIKRHPEAWQALVEGDKQKRAKGK
jgi:hypothetical protein